MNGYGPGRLEPKNPGRPEGATNQSTEWDLLFIYVTDSLRFESVKLYYKRFLKVSNSAIQV